MPFAPTGTNAVCPDLVFDFYEPNGDTLTERPLLVYLHTGTFAPRFLNNNPTIEFVYCTTKFSQLHHLEILWNQIIENVNRTNITFGCIRTPSPQGGFPDQNIMGGVINGTAKINAIVLGCTLLKSYLDSQRFRFSSVSASAQDCMA